MSMMRKIFIPGAGSTLARYTAAVAAETMYPTDWVALSTLAPGSQGVTAGEFRGQSLGANDYIECVLLDTDDAGAEGLALGCVVGNAIGAVANWANVSGDGLADGDVAIIQSWGIHPQGRQAASGVLGDQLAPGATAGEVTNSTTVAAADVGVCMIATATYQQITAADEDGSVVFITCDG